MEIIKRKKQKTKLFIKTFSKTENIKKKENLLKSGGKIFQFETKFSESIKNSTSVKAI